MYLYELRLADKEKQNAHNIHETLKGETGIKNISMQLEDMLLSFHTNSRTVSQNQAVTIFFRVPAYSLFATSPVTVNSLNC